MMTVSPETRHRNLVTFLLLIVFAIGLCLAVFWSMQVHARRLDEAAHAAPATTLRLQLSLFSAA